MLWEERHLVLYPCRNCDKLYVAKHRNYKSTCSDKCSMERLRASWRAMIDKTGPMYDKWLRKTKAASIHQKRMSRG